MASWIIWLPWVLLLIIYLGEKGTSAEESHSVQSSRLVPDWYSMYRNAVSDLMVAEAKLVDMMEPKEETTAASSPTTTQALKTVDDLLQVVCSKRNCTESAKLCEILKAVKNPPSTTPLYQPSLSPASSNKQKPQGSVLTQVQSTLVEVDVDHPVDSADYAEVVPDQKKRRIVNVKGVGGKPPAPKLRDYSRRKMILERKITAAVVYPPLVRREEGMVSGVIQVKNQTTDRPIDTGYPVGPAPAPIASNVAHVIQKERYQQKPIQAENQLFLTESRAVSRSPGIPFPDPPAVQKPVEMDQVRKVVSHEETTVTQAPAMQYKTVDGEGTTKIMHVRYAAKGPKQWRVRLHKTIIPGSPVDMYSAPLKDTVGRLNGESAKRDYSSQDYSESIRRKEKSGAVVHFSNDTVEREYEEEEYDEEDGVEVPQFYGPEKLGKEETTTDNGTAEKARSGGVRYTDEIMHREGLVDDYSEEASPQNFSQLRKGPEVDLSSSVVVAQSVVQPGIHFLNESFSRGGLIKEDEEVDSGRLIESLSTTMTPSSSTPNMSVNMEEKRVEGDGPTKIKRVRVILKDAKQERLREYSTAAPSMPFAFTRPSASTIRIDDHVERGHVAEDYGETENQRKSIRKEVMEGLPKVAPLVAPGIRFSNDSIHRDDAVEVADYVDKENGDLSRVRKESGIPLSSVVVVAPSPVQQGIHFLNESFFRGMIMENEEAEDGRLKELVIISTTMTPSSVNTKVKRVRVVSKNTKLKRLREYNIATQSTTSSAASVTSSNGSAIRLTDDHVERDYVAEDYGENESRHMVNSSKILSVYLPQVASLVVSRIKLSNDSIHQLNKVEIGNYIDEERKERLVQASPGIKASDVPQSRGSLDADEYPDELPTMQSVLPSQNTLAEQLVVAQSGQAGIRVSNESLSRGFLPPEEYPDHVEPTTPGGAEENVQLSLPVIAQSIHFLNDSFPRGFLLEEEGQEDTNGKEVTDKTSNKSVRISAVERRSNGVHVSDVPASRNYLPSEDYSEKGVTARSKKFGVKIHFDDVPYPREMADDYSESLPAENRPNITVKTDVKKAKNVALHFLQESLDRDAANSEDYTENAGNKSGAPVAPEKVETKPGRQRIEVDVQSSTEELSKNLVPLNGVRYSNVSMHREVPLSEDYSESQLTTAASSPALFFELTSASIPQPVRPLKTVNGIRFTDDSIGRSVSTEDYPEPFISGNISVSLRVQPSGTSGSALSMRPSGSSKAEVPSTVQSNDSILTATKRLHYSDVPSHRESISEDYSEKLRVHTTKQDGEADNVIPKIQQQDVIVKGIRYTDEGTPRTEDLEDHQDVSPYRSAARNTPVEPQSAPRRAASVKVIDGIRFTDEKMRKTVKDEDYPEALTKLAVVIQTGNATKRDEKADKVTSEVQQLHVVAKGIRFTDDRIPRTEDLGDHQEVAPSHATTPLLPVEKQAGPQRVASVKVIHGIRFTDEHIRKIVKDEDYPEASTKDGVVMQTGQPVQGVHVDDVPQSRDLLSSEDYSEAAILRASKALAAGGEIRRSGMKKSAQISANDVYMEEEKVPLSVKNITSVLKGVHFGDVPSHRDGFSEDYSEKVSVDTYGTAGEKKQLVLLKVQQAPVVQGIRYTDDGNPRTEDLEDHQEVVPTASITPQQLRERQESVNRQPMSTEAAVEDKKTSKPSAPAIRVSDDSLSLYIPDSMNYPETVLQRQSPRRPFTNTSDQMQQGKRFVSVTPGETGIHVNDESISRGFLASENALDETTTTTSPAIVTIIPKTSSVGIRYTDESITRVETSEDYPESLIKTNLSAFLPSRLSVLHLESAQPTVKPLVKGVYVDDVPASRGSLRSQDYPEVEVLRKTVVVNVSAILTDKVPLPKPGKIHVDDIPAHRGVADDYSEKVQVLSGVRKLAKTDKPGIHQNDIPSHREISADYPEVVHVATTTAPSSAIPQNSMAALQKFEVETSQSLEEDSKTARPVSGIHYGDSTVHREPSGSEDYSENLPNHVSTVLPNDKVPVVPKGVHMDDVSISRDRLGSEDYSEVNVVKPGVAITTKNEVKESVPKNASSTKGAFGIHYKDVPSHREISNDYFEAAISHSVPSSVRSIPAAIKGLHYSDVPAHRDSSSEDYGETVLINATQQDGKEAKVSSEVQQLHVVAKGIRFTDDRIPRTEDLEDHQEVAPSHPTTPLMPVEKQAGPQRAASAKVIHGIRFTDEHILKIVKDEDYPEASTRSAVALTSRSVQGVHVEDIPQSRGLVSSEDYPEVSILTASKARVTVGEVGGSGIKKAAQVSAVDISLDEDKVSLSVKNMTSVSKGVHFGDEPAHRDSFSEDYNEKVPVNAFLSVRQKEQLVSPKEQLETVGKGIRYTDDADPRSEDLDHHEEVVPSSSTTPKLPAEGQAKAWKAGQKAVFDVLDRKAPATKNGVRYTDVSIHGELPFSEDYAENQPTSTKGLAVPQQAASAKVMHGIRFTDEHIRKTVKDEDYPEASTKYAVALQTSRPVQGIHVEDVPQSRGVLLSEDYPEVTTVKLSHERPPFDKVRDFMNTRAAQVSVMDVSVDEEEAKTTPISNVSSSVKNITSAPTRVHYDDVPSHRDSLSEDYSEKVSVDRYVTAGEKERQVSPKVEERPVVEGIRYTDDGSPRTDDLDDHQEVVPSSSTSQKQPLEGQVEAGQKAAFSPNLITGDLNRKPTEMKNGIRYTNVSIHRELSTSEDYADNQPTLTEVAVKKTSKHSSPAIRVSDDSLSRGILDSMDYPEVVLSLQAQGIRSSNASDQVQQKGAAISVVPAKTGIHVNDDSIFRGFLASEDAVAEMITTISPTSMTTSKKAEVGVRYTDESIPRVETSEDYPESLIKTNLSAFFPSRLSVLYLESAQPAVKPLVKGVHVDDVPASRGSLRSQDYPEVEVLRKTVVVNVSAILTDKVPLPKPGKIHVDDIPFHRGVADDYSEKVQVLSGVRKLAKTDKPGIHQNDIPSHREMSADYPETLPVILAPSTASPQKTVAARQKVDVEATQCLEKDNAVSSVSNGIHYGDVAIHRKPSSHEDYSENQPFSVTSAPSVEQKGSVVAKGVHMDDVSISKDFLGSEDYSEVDAVKSGIVITTNNKLKESVLTNASSTNKASGIHYKDVSTHREISTDYPEELTQATANSSGAVYIAARTPQPTGVVLSSASAGKIHVDDVPVHRGIANDYSEATSTGKQVKLEQGKKKGAPGIHYDEVPVHRGSSDDYAETLTGVLSREVTSNDTVAVLQELRAAANGIRHTDENFEKVVRSEDYPEVPIASSSTQFSTRLPQTVSPPLVPSNSIHFTDDSVSRGLISEDYGEAVVPSSPLAGQAMVKVNATLQGRLKKKTRPIHVNDVSSHRGIADDYSEKILNFGAKTAEPVELLSTFPAAKQIHVDDVPSARGIAGDYSEVTVTEKQVKVEQRKKAVPGIHYNEVPVHRDTSEDYPEISAAVFSTAKPADVTFNNTVAVLGELKPAAQRIRHTDENFQKVVRSEDYPEALIRSSSSRAEKSDAVSQVRVKDKTPPIHVDDVPSHRGVAADYSEKIQLSTAAVRQTMPPAKGIHVQDEPMSREALSSVDYVESPEGISLITSATTATPSNRLIPVASDRVHYLQEARSRGVAEGEDYSEVAPLHATARSRTQKTITVSDSDKNKVARQKNETDAVLSTEDDRADKILVSGIHYSNISVHGETPLSEDYSETHIPLPAALPTVLKETSPVTIRAEGIHIHNLSMPRASLPAEDYVEAFLSSLSVENVSVASLRVEQAQEILSQKKVEIPGIHFDEVPVYRGSSDDYPEATGTQQASTKTRTIVSSSLRSTSSASSGLHYGDVPSHPDSFSEDYSEKGPVNAPMSVQVKKQPLFPKVHQVLVVKGIRYTDEGISRTEDLEDHQEVAPSGSITSKQPVEGQVVASKAGQEASFDVTLKTRDSKRNPAAANSRVRYTDISVHRDPPVFEDYVDNQPTSTEGLGVPQQGVSAKMIHGIRFTDEIIRQTVKDDDYPEASTSRAIVRQTNRPVQGVHVEDVPHSRGVLSSEDYAELNTAKLAKELPPVGEVRDAGTKKAAQVSVMDIFTYEEEKKNQTLLTVPSTVQKVPSTIKALHYSDVPSHRGTVSEDYSEKVLVSAAISSGRIDQQKRFPEVQLKPVIVKGIRYTDERLSRTEDLEDHPEAISPAQLAQVAHENKFKASQPLSLDILPPMPQHSLLPPSLPPVRRIQYSDISVQRDIALPSQDYVDADIITVVPSSTSTSSSLYGNEVRKEVRGIHFNEAPSHREVLVEDYPEGAARPVLPKAVEAKHPVLLASPAKTRLRAEDVPMHRESESEDYDEVQVALRQQAQLNHSLSAMNTVSVVQGIHYGNVSFDRDLSTDEYRQEMEDQARKSVEITSLNQTSGIKPEKNILSGIHITNISLPRTVQDSSDYPETSLNFSIPTMTDLGEPLRKVVKAKDSPVRRLHYAETSISRDHVPSAEDYFENLPEHTLPSLSPLPIVQRLRYTNESFSRVLDKTEDYPEVTQAAQSSGRKTAGQSREDLNDRWNVNQTLTAPPGAVLVRPSGSSGLKDALGREDYDEAMVGHANISMAAMGPWMNASLFQPISNAQAIVTDMTAYYFPLQDIPQASTTAEPGETVTETVLPYDYDEATMGTTTVVPETPKTPPPVQPARLRDRVVKVQADLSGKPIVIVQSMKGLGRLSGRKDVYLDESTNVHAYLHSPGLFREIARHNPTVHVSAGKETTTEVPQSFPVLGKAKVYRSPNAYGIERADRHEEDVRDDSDGLIVPFVERIMKVQDCTNCSATATTQPSTATDATKNVAREHKKAAATRVEDDISLEQDDEESTNATAPSVRKPGISFTDVPYGQGHHVDEDYFDVIEANKTSEQSTSPVESEAKPRRSYNNATYGKGHVVEDDYPDITSTSTTTEKTLSTTEQSLVSSTTSEPSKKLHYTNDSTANGALRVEDYDEVKNVSQYRSNVQTVQSFPLPFFLPPVYPQPAFVQQVVQQPSRLSPVLPVQRVRLRYEEGESRHLAHEGEDHGELQRSTMAVSNSMPPVAVTKAFKGEAFEDYDEKRVTKPTMTKPQMSDAESGVVEGRTTVAPITRPRKYFVRPASKERVAAVLGLSIAPNPYRWRSQPASQSPQFQSVPPAVRPISYRYRWRKTATTLEPPPPPQPQPPLTYSQPMPQQPQYQPPVQRPQQVPPQLQTQPARPAGYRWRGKQVNPLPQTPVQPRWPTINQVNQASLPMASKKPFSGGYRWSHGQRAGVQPVSVPMVPFIPIYNQRPQVAPPASFFTGRRWSKPSPASGPVQVPVVQIEDPVTTSKPEDIDMDELHITKLSRLPKLNCVDCGSNQPGESNGKNSSSTFESKVLTYAVSASDDDDTNELHKIFEKNDTMSVKEETVMPEMLTSTSTESVTEEPMVVVTMTLTPETSKEVSVKQASTTTDHDEESEERSDKDWTIIASLLVNRTELDVHNSSNYEKGQALRRICTPSLRMDDQSVTQTVDCSQYDMSEVPLPVAVSLGSGSFSYEMVTLNNGAQHQDKFSVDESNGNLYATAPFTNVTCPSRDFLCPNTVYNVNVRVYDDMCDFSAQAVVSVVFRCHA